MPFVKPLYSKNDVNKAGDILSAEKKQENGEWANMVDVMEYYWARDVLSNWRSSHGHPMNTFQSLLRQRSDQLDKDAIVAQRIKREPSVLLKLRRFKTMKLSQMQDIAGLRAILSDSRQVQVLLGYYLNSRFKHKLVTIKDYIKNPKNDGYRSVHLVYKYNNKKATEYNGMQLEIQLRSRYQHAWATSVETMGTFLGQALKSGQGESQWRKFFEISSAAIAFMENSPLVPGYECMSKKDLIQMLRESEEELGFLNMLRGFVIAANQIEVEPGTGRYYHLVVLDSDLRTVNIKPYSQDEIDKAEKQYSEYERRANDGENIEAVLISAGNVGKLKKAYPNYFLDTREFLKIMKALLG